MHVRLIRIGAVALMLATALVFVGCSDDDADEPAAGGDPTAAADPEADPEADPVAGGGHEVGTLTNFDETVEVDLMEWAVNPDRASVPAGLVRFVATNDGSEVHEFVLIEGTSKDGDEVTEIEGIAPGDSREIAARLEPGTYQLACLIVEVEGGETEDHYDLGMHIEFTVE